MDVVIDWLVVDAEEVVVLLAGRFSTRAKVVPFLVI